LAEAKIVELKLARVKTMVAITKTVHLTTFFNILMTYFLNSELFVIRLCNILLTIVSIKRVVDQLLCHNDECG